MLWHQRQAKHSPPAALYFCNCQRFLTGIVPLTVAQPTCSGPAGVQMTWFGPPAALCYWVLDAHRQLCDVPIPDFVTVLTLA